MTSNFKVGKQQACRPWVCRVCHGTQILAYQLCNSISTRGDRLCPPTGTPGFSDLLTALGQAASDFTKQAYVLKYLIRVSRYVGRRQVKNTKKTSVCEWLPKAPQNKVEKKNCELCDFF